MMIDKYYSLCTPAQVYFLLSVISFLAMLFQNLKDQKKYSIGNFTVNVRHGNYVLFFIKFAYILVWTFVLNELCRKGWTSVSWFLVFFPVLLMFVLISIILMANM